MIDKFVTVNHNEKSISLKDDATPNNVFFRYFVDKLGYSTTDDKPEEIKRASFKKSKLKGGFPWLTKETT